MVIWKAVHSPPVPSTSGCPSCTQILRLLLTRTISHLALTNRTRRAAPFPECTITYLPSCAANRNRKAILLVQFPVSDWWDVTFWPFLESCAFLSRRQRKLWSIKICFGFCFMVLSHYWHTILSTTLDDRGYSESYNGDSERDEMAAGQLYPLPRITAEPWGRRALLLSPNCAHGAQRNTRQADKKILMGSECHL